MSERGRRLRSQNSLSTFRRIPEGSISNVSTLKLWEHPRQVSASGCFPFSKREQ